MKRDPYKAIMVAAALGRRVRLTQEEIFDLSMDDAIMTRAVNALTAEEIAAHGGGGYYGWKNISPYIQGEPANIYVDQSKERGDVREALKEKK